MSENLLIFIVIVLVVIMVGKEVSSLYITAKSIKASAEQTPQSSITQWKESIDAMGKVILEVALNVADKTKTITWDDDLLKTWATIKGYDVETRDGMIVLITRKPTPPNAAEGTPPAPPSGLG